MVFNVTFNNISVISWRCVFAFFMLWKRVKTHVLSDQSVHITHTYCCVSKLSKFGAYLYSRVHNNTLLSLRNSWFIVNIQSDLFWHRCLGRQAFGTPRMYTLSPSKSIKGSNYREFLKDQIRVYTLRIHIAVLANFPNSERTGTVLYITIHFCLWEIPRNYFPLYFSKEISYTSEGYRKLAFLSIRRVNGPKGQ
jgi:hypothetical protein